MDQLCVRKAAALDALGPEAVKVKTTLTDVFETVLRKAALDDIEEIDVLKQSVSATLETPKTIDAYRLEHQAARNRTSGNSFSDYTR